MRSLLIEAIRTEDPEITQLFEYPFNMAWGWIWYLRQHLAYGKSVSVTRVLDRTTPWERAQFQALYVACWIYHPVEKGSYMIQLNESQLANARASVATLPTRISSHLSGTSYTAGKGFRFVKGYRELLVIVYDNYLFLKMEGHKVTSPSHMKSWVTKIRTGEGEIANHHLHGLSHDSKWGILGRGAENYSKGYKSLLKALGFSGKTVTFGDVIARLQQTFPTVSMPPGNDTTALRGYIEKLYTLARSSPFVINSKYYQPLMDARPDLEGIIKDLQKDDRRMPSGGQHLGVDRIFREMRLSPERIDRKLQKFFRAVQAHDFEGVKGINNDWRTGSD